MVTTEEQAERQPLLSGESTRQSQDLVKSNIVRFDPNGDEDNPLDWPIRYRWGITILLACMAFTV